jgi:type I restriction enzyme R subunit
VLDALLTKYADEGVLSLDDANVLRVTPFTSMGSVMELVRAFGGKQGFEQAVQEMQTEIYRDSA